MSARTLGPEGGRYKWYQSQTPNDVPVRTLGPKGGGFRGGPTSIGGRKECQREHWVQKGVDCDRTNHHLQGCENLPLPDAF